MIVTESSGKISSFKYKEETKNRIIQTDDWEDIFTKLKDEKVTEIIIGGQPPESTRIIDLNKNCAVYEEDTI